MPDDHPSSQVQLILIGLGLFLVLIGLLWPLLQKAGLGWLQGDIRIEKDNFKLIFPVTTATAVAGLRDQGKDEKGEQ